MLHAHYLSMRWLAQYLGLSLGHIGPVKMDGTILNQGAYAHNSHLTGVYATLCGLACKGKQADGVAPFTVSREQDIPSVRTR